MPANGWLILPTTHGIIIAVESVRIRRYFSMVRLLFIGYKSLPVGI